MSDFEVPSSINEASMLMPKTILTVVVLASFPTYDFPQLTRCPCTDYYGPES